MPPPVKGEVKVPVHDGLLLGLVNVHADPVQFGYPVVMEPSVCPRSPVTVNAPVLARDTSWEAATPTGTFEPFPIKMLVLFRTAAINCEEEFEAKSALDAGTLAPLTPTTVSARDPGELLMSVVNVGTAVVGNVVTP